MSDFWWCILNDYNSGKCARPSAAVAFYILCAMLVGIGYAAFANPKENLTADVIFIAIFVIILAGFAFCEAYL